LGKREVYLRVGRMAWNWVGWSVGLKVDMLAMMLVVLKGGKMAESKDIYLALRMVARLVC
jgi:hypothetical protein